MYYDLPYSDDLKTDLAKRLFTHLEHRTTDLLPSTMTIPSSVYHDAELAVRERRDIFGRVPTIAAHGSEVANENDFVTAQLPNNEALIVRQSDGSVRAFVNICRHRGARLVLDEAGTSRFFSCGYHGWTYGANGQLRAIAQGPTFGDLDKQCLGLPELPVEERHGFVWVTDSTDAEPTSVVDWLGPELDETLSSFELDTYMCYRAGNFDEPINWKVLMDGFVDNYHITATHANTVAPYFHNNVQVCDEIGRHIRAVSARRSIDKIRDGSSPGASIDRHVTIAHFIMPNVNILRQPDHFQLLNFVPDPFDVNASRMQMRILIKEPATTAEQRQRWDKNWDILMAVLRDEDLVVNRNLQRAVRNEGAPDLILGRNEVVNQFFHSWLLNTLADETYSSSSSVMTN